MIILIPFEIKLHAVPHLKGLINGIYTSSGLRGGSLYVKTKDHGLWENLILVHKTRFGPIFILASVLTKSKAQDMNFKMPYFGWLIAKLSGIKEIHWQE